MLSTITVNTSSVTLVSFPTNLLVSSFEMGMSDATSEVTSIFTGQTQTQMWPGGEMWTGTATLSLMTQADADDWIAFLMQLRGTAYAFQMGDPLKQSPRGTPSGTPVVDNSLNNGNPAMSFQIGTSGWTASTNNLLLRGDFIQVGYKLYRVLDTVDSNSSGDALISIWPSLRFTPTNDLSVVTSNTQGLWRLAGPQRTYSHDYTRLTSMSFKFKEYR